MTRRLCDKQLATGLKRATLEVLTGRLIPNCECNDIADQDRQSRGMNEPPVQRRG